MVKNDSSQISVDRMQGESDAAYASKVQYLLMGKNRSISNLADIIFEEKHSDQATVPKRKKATLKSTNRMLMNWSSAYKWRETAISYDEAMASIAIKAYQKNYLSEIEKHREKYKKIGEAIFSMGQAYLARIGKKLQDTASQDKKVYIPLKRIPGDLKSIASTLLIASDFEAHALRLNNLVDQIEREDD